MPNTYCNESDCDRRATHLIIVEAENVTTGLDGFTIPACREHTPQIRKVVERLCEGEDVDFQVLPMETE